MSEVIATLDGLSPVIVVILAVGIVLAVLDRVVYWLGSFGGEGH